MPTKRPDSFALGLGVVMQYYGLTRTELGERTGLCRHSVGRILSGVTAHANPETRERICEALSLEFDEGGDQISDLLDGIGSMARYRILNVV